MNQLGIRRRPPVRQSAMLLIAVLGFVASARGDVFVLKTGARIRGDWLNSEESPIRRYVVRWEPGGRITIDARQVSEHIREPTDVSEYDRFAPSLSDTVADQWRIAEWCRARGLKEQQRQHLWRVIELDPDHTAARQALGFTEIQGKWVTTKDFFLERGYVYFQGKWRLPQEVDVMEERRQIERLERDWFARLKTWRGQLGTERDADAVRSLAAIREPTALKALAENLRREKTQRVRVLLVGSVANIRVAGAIELLTQTALNDADVEVFHASVEKLVASQTPGLSKALTEVLKDSSNRRVNRAAYVLGRLGDRKAIPALAAALVTTHQVALPSNSRGTSATFVQPTPTGPGAAGASSLGGGLDGGNAFTAGHQPKSAPIQIANQEVLGALVKLSGGQSFGFDERAWMNWWASASRTGGAL